MKSWQYILHQGQLACIQAGQGGKYAPVFLLCGAVCTVIGCAWFWKGR